MKITEAAPGVFRFKVFTPKRARDFLYEIQEFALQDGQPNSMNKYGKVIGGKARPWLADMQQELVDPIAWGRFGIRQLKKHPYVFTVEYDVKKQRSLAAHFDSSSVTMNICLAGDFSGGDVVFEGQGRKRYAVKNEVGYAIVHLGAHIHRATKLTRGTRTNLIFWCQERAR